MKTAYFLGRADKVTPDNGLRAFPRTCAQRHPQNMGASLTRVKVLTLYILRQYF